MKKEKFNKKLVLNKETISNLNNIEMDNVKGGQGGSEAANSTCLLSNYCHESYMTDCHAIAN